MSSKLDRAIATCKAHQAAESFREALTEARAALDVAKAEVSRLDTERAKAWHTAYNNSLNITQADEAKEQEEDADHSWEYRLRSQRFALNRLEDHLFTARHHPGF